LAHLQGYSDAVDWLL